MAATTSTIRDTIVAALNTAAEVDQLVDLLLIGFK